MEVAPLVDSEEFINAMFFGDPGAGKTSAAASMAHTGKVLIINLESGVNRRSLMGQGIPVENIVVTHGLKTYEQLVSLIQKLADGLAKNPDAYVGVVLDSVTELQDKLTENLVGERHAKRIRSGMKDDEFEIDGDTRIRVSGQVTRVCRMLRDLPCHTVITALQKEDKENDGTIYYRPALGPKTATAVASYMHIVMHMELEKGSDGARRIGRANPVGKYRGKDNTGCMPERMLNPTFDRVRQVIGHELTTEDVDADRPDVVEA